MASSAWATKTAAGTRRARWQAPPSAGATLLCPDSYARMLHTHVRDGVADRRMCGLAGCPPLRGCRRDGCGNRFIKIFQLRDSGTTFVEGSSGVYLSPRIAQDGWDSWAVLRVLAGVDYGVVLVIESLVAASGPVRRRAGAWNEPVEGDGEARGTGRWTEEGNARALGVRCVR